MSFPQGASVNDGSPRRVPPKVVSVDDAAQLILELGVDAFMGKLDIRQAYHNVPVHLQDWWLLGMYVVVRPALCRHSATVLAALSSEDILCYLMDWSGCYTSPD